MSDNKKWVVWFGGDCPVPLDTRVEITARDGKKEISFADKCDWSHDDNKWGDIICYRVISKVGKQ